MIEQINLLFEEVKGLTAANAEELEALRLKYLSKKGIINGLMAQFREVPAEQKREVGVKLNELRMRYKSSSMPLKRALQARTRSYAE